MNKFSIKTLDNGITLLMCNNPKKHIVQMSIITRFGGSDVEFLKNGEKETISSGLAHFIEHYIIEFSKYGNAYKHFTEEQYCDFNGVTDLDSTEFYVQTPHDYLDIFKELLEVVNEPIFEKENIETNKPEIIEEINKKEDDKFTKFHYFVNDCVYKVKKEIPILGTKDDIKSLTLEEVKRAFKAFYRPSNQIITISGNFDEEAVENVINEYYKDYDNDEKIEKIKYYEPLEINKEYGEKFDKVHKEYEYIVYKLDIKELSQEERIKLDYYLGIFLSNNFGDVSELYQKLVDEHVLDFSINASSILEDDILTIKIGTYTNDAKKFAYEVDKTINKRYIDEDYFNVRKNTVLISEVIREDNPHFILKRQLRYYMAFEYEDKFSIELFDKYTYEDALKYLNKLDFNNKCIAILKPEEENTK